MFRKLLFVGLLFAAAALAGGLWFAVDYQAHLPQHLSQHETIVLGQNRFTPGTQTALRVVVRDSRDARPLPDATIRLSLQPPGGGSAIPIYTGATDDHGTADVAFHVPDDAEGDQTLINRAQSKMLLMGISLNRPSYAAPAQTANTPKTAVAASQIQSTVETLRAIAQNLVGTLERHG